jgi:hypothetical protein
MAQTGEDKFLRDHLVENLRGRNAHISFDDLAADFPVNQCGERITGLPYTAWQVLEHMRIAQWDILEFSRNAKHVSPKWPEGYWPAPNEAGDSKLWQETVKSFRSDFKELEALVTNQSIDLFAKIPHGNGQTILREILLVADHNSYHLGVLLAISRILAS